MSTRQKVLLVCVVAMISLSCAPIKNEKSSDGNTGSVIIDVRTPAEFEQGHLMAATNIPHTEIAEKIVDHVKSKEDRITVYCRSGHRAGIAKTALEAMGYTNVINVGGYATLKDQEDKNQ